MCGLVALVWLSSATNAFAQGEHGRRAAAELRVLTGDTRELLKLSMAETKTPQQKGLADRIRGGLSGIQILMRLADMEAGRAPVSYSQTMQELMLQSDANNWQELQSLLTPLVAEFPLTLPRYPDTEALIKSSKELHHTHCAACHDHPAQETQRPAFNLYQQIASMDELDFFARMLVGVRGDRVTGIDNPLSDIEINGLMSHYRKGMTDR